MSCRSRIDEFTALPDTTEDGVAFRFPPIPEGGVITDLEWDGGHATLSVEVSDPAGPLVCGSAGCPHCDKFHPDFSPPEADRREPDPEEERLAIHRRWERRVCL